VTDADIYQCHEFDTQLPGDSLMEIKVMDYDTFGSKYVWGGGGGRLVD